MTLIFKVNRQSQKIYFSFFDFLDPKNVRIDTKIKSVPRLQPEKTKVIQKGVWPWISRSSNGDRIFSLSPLDSLTPKTYPYVIFSKNSYGKTKIQGGWYPPPLRSPKVDFYLRSPRVNTRKAKVNRQLRKANPGSCPDPREKHHIFSSIWAI